MWHFYSRDLPKERDSREVTSSSDVPSIRSKSVCASVVQDCFFLCFLCHLAGTCEYKGLPFLGEKEGKSGKETLNVFSFNDIKKSNVSVCDALFLSSKTVTSKNTSSKRVEVFSSALDAQIDCQNSTRNQLKFAIYLHDWLIFIYLVVEASPCFFPFIFGCIFCYLMFKLNFGMEVVVLVRNCWLWVHGMGQVLKLSKLKHLVSFSFWYW